MKRLGFQICAAVFFVTVIVVLLLIYRGLSSEQGTSLEETPRAPVDSRDPEDVIERIRSLLPLRADDCTDLLDTLDNDRSMNQMEPLLFHKTAERFRDAVYALNGSGILLPSAMDIARATRREFQAGDTTIQPAVMEMTIPELRTASKEILISVRQNIDLLIEVLRPAGVQPREENL